MAKKKPKVEEIEPELAEEVEDALDDAELADVDLDEEEELEGEDLDEVEVFEEEEELAVEELEAEPAEEVAETDEETEEALDELEAEELELLEDEVSETLLVDEVAELRAIRREELTLNVEAQAIRPGEFVCQSCFLVKRISQLANRKKMICRDCAP
jgi:hypothetical protein